MRQGGGRQKGNNFELKMARKLSVWWEQPGADKLPAKELWFRRTPLSGGWGSSVTAGDIVAVAKEAQDFPFSPEMKCQECWDWSGLVNRNDGWPVLGYWKQCREAAKLAKLIPLLVFTKNHSQIYCATYPELLIDLQLAYLEHTGLSGIGFLLMDDLMTIPKADIIKTCAHYLASIREEEDGSTGATTTQTAPTVG